MEEISLIITEELICRDFEIVASRDKYLIGRKGHIIFEDHDYFWIEEMSKTKKILKKINTFLFTFRGKKVAVDGRLLVGEPWERIKKGLHLLRKWRIPEFFFK